MIDPPKTPLTDLEIVWTLTGSTQSRGQLSVLIRNNLEHEIQTLYLETMPWLVQFYLHTARISVDGKPRSTFCYHDFLTFVLNVLHFF